MCYANRFVVYVQSLLSFLSLRKLGDIICKSTPSERKAVLLKGEIINFSVGHLSHIADFTPVVFKKSADAPITDGSYSFLSKASRE